MMTILASMLVGAVISSMMAAFTTRNRLFFFLYVGIGCAIACAHVTFPLLNGQIEPSFRPLRITALVGVVVGIAILFSPGTSRR